MPWNTKFSKGINEGKKKVILFLGWREKKRRKGKKQHENVLNK